MSFDFWRLNQPPRGVCRRGKLSVLNARHFLNHMTRIAQSLVVDENVTRDVVSMARHCLEFALCLRRNETARSKHRAHVPSSNDFSVDGRVVVHAGASKSDTDSAVRPPFAKVSLFDEGLTSALVHLVFDHANVNGECLGGMGATAVFRQPSGCRARDRDE